jgi:5-methylcytosine-specific restriction protein A
MAQRPPVFRPRYAPVTPKQRGGWDRTRSRQARGYGRDHEKMRERVLEEEPFCRPCLAEGRTSLTTVADHIVCKAEGGGDERENYQGSCDDCHKIKTIEERKRAVERNRAAAGPD